ncbi:GNAT family N-acetyltransferase [Deltaproteobacteria bacterium Smac51]|nr:GNAT family N-acetyltransferase [Deltaproteobacteria bacterium Smac51]
MCDMKICKAESYDYAAMLEIWERAVRATHSFLTETDIEELRPQVKEAFQAVGELYALHLDDGQAAGFMGLTPPDGDRRAKLEMLFVDPAYHGRGLGYELTCHALEKYPDLDVDVNEQNPKAAAFYEKCGFVVIGRSEIDGEGRPFPLLHLRKAPSVSIA